MRKAKPIGFRDLIWVSLDITLGSVAGKTNRVPKCGTGGRESFHLYGQQADLREIHPWTGSQRYPKDRHLIWKTRKGIWEMKWIIPTFQQLSQEENSGFLIPCSVSIPFQHSKTVWLVYTYLYPELMNRWHVSAWFVLHFLLFLDPESYKRFTLLKNIVPRSPIFLF